MRLGDKIKLIRETRGMSQGALANLMDCSQVTVSRWESGRCGFQADDLDRLADALGVSPSFFYTPAPWKRAEEAQHAYDAAMEEVHATLLAAMSDNCGYSRHRTLLATA